MISVKLERRLERKRFLVVSVPAMSIFAALVAGAVFLEATGRPSGAVLSHMAEAAFGSMDGITNTLGTCTPLIFTGLAAAIAMRMGLYNIGGEGQLYAGAIASSGAALAWTQDASTPFAITVVFVAGAVGGMVWILIPALARAFLGTSEVITTLMMVFVADRLLDYLILGSDSYWRDPLSVGFPKGERIPEAAQFAKWFDGSLVTVALPVAVVMVLVVWAIGWRTSLGFEMKVIGDSPNAARYAGIAQRRTIVVALLMSGALAGMAGATEVGARAYQLDPGGLRLSLGFTGIVVAALARANPFGAALVAFFLGGLQSAGRSIQAASDVQVPKSLALTLQGTILLFVLGGEIFSRYRPRVAFNAATPHERLGAEA